MIQFISFWISLNLLFNMLYFIVKHQPAQLRIAILVAICSAVWYSVMVSLSKM